MRPNSTACACWAGVAERATPKVLSDPSQSRTIAQVQIASLSKPYSVVLLLNGNWLFTPHLHPRLRDPLRDSHYAGRFAAHSCSGIRMEQAEPGARGPHSFNLSAALGPIFRRIVFLFGELRQALRRTWLMWNGSAHFLLFLLQKSSGRET